MFTKKAAKKELNQPINILSHAQVLAAENMYAKRSVDNSPTLDMSLFTQLNEQTSGLNLGILAHSFSSLCEKLPLFVQVCKNHPAVLKKEGYLMAAAFEAGRRYAIISLAAMLEEEVNVLPDSASETVDQPVMEQ